MCDCSNSYLEGLDTEHTMVLKSAMYSHLRKLRVWGDLGSIYVDKEIQQSQSIINSIEDYTNKQKGA